MYRYVATDRVEAVPFDMAAPGHTASHNWNFLEQHIQKAEAGQPIFSDSMLLYSG